MKSGEDDEGEKTSEQEKKKNGEGWKTIELSISGQQKDPALWPRQYAVACLLRSQGE